MAGRRGRIEGMLAGLQSRKLADPGAPETVRVRLVVDLRGEAGEELSRLVKANGMTTEDMVREGLTYIHRALQSRNDGLFVGRP